MQQMRPRNPQSQQRPVRVQPRPPRRKLRFRWNILAVFLGILLGAFLVSGTRPAGTWQGFMEAIGIVHERRFTQLCILGIVAVVIAAVVRILGHGRKEQ